MVWRGIGLLAVAAGTAVAVTGAGTAAPAHRTSGPATLELSFASTPPGTATSQLSRFEWMVGDPGASISCSVDGGGSRSCSSPARVTLSAGRHTFAVRAASVVAGASITYSWRISPSAYSFLEPVRPDLSAAEQEFLGLVNRARARLGRRPLIVSTKLAVAADSHSYWQDLALGNGLSHYGYRNSDPGRRISDAGYRASAWGEVTLISNPPASARTAFTMFRNSAPHWPILISAGLADIGVGASTYHWTVDLGSPVGGADA